MSVLSMQQLAQQQTRGSPHILPPLQSQQIPIGLSHQIYGQSVSAPHTPRTPNTPHTPISAGGNGSFSHMAQQASPYLQSPQPYSSPASLVSPVSVAQSHPQAIAPAPALGRPQVPLRPMPLGGFNQMSHPTRSQYGPSQVLSQPPVVPNQEAQPTHVVGSQGRRGILPSAPGRAAAVTGAGGSKNTSIPAKDADGKFPCPHCNKSYLHAKHLKRHLLRHTGDRPYMCVLCKDTFSRSDILKRHFQKCSLRRGNPTGASHLSQSHAHHKRQHPGSHKVTTPGSDRSSIGDSKILRNGSSRNVMTPSPPRYTNEQRPDSDAVSRGKIAKRSSSDDGDRDSRSLTGPGPSGSHRRGMDIAEHGRIVAAMSSTVDPSIAAFPASGAGQNGYSNGFGYHSHGSGHGPHYSGDPRAHDPLGHMSHDSSRGESSYFNGSQTQTSDMDWPNLFQTESHDTLMNPMLQSNMSHGQAPIKSEPLENGSFESTADGHHGIFNNLY
ncbi:hypothetical protein FGG08_002217 [Glutinoglossum americanum]|uniref:C2H2-type domain-containing protein n=1 Tax=Glutinoglossum americanum TaxID=1670608 RepID=A0A9P8IC08_9PEZI|nr:hypothetical protein FGG08_002217 [Glutinoglossum americanum]